MRQSVRRRARMANPPTAPPTIAPMGVECADGEEMMVVVVVGFVLVCAGGVSEVFEADIDIGEDVVVLDEAIAGLLSVPDILGAVVVVPSVDSVVGLVAIVVPSADTVVGLVTSVAIEVSVGVSVGLSVGLSIGVLVGVSIGVSVGVLSGIVVGVTAGGAVVEAGAEFPTYTICNGFGSAVFSPWNDVATVVPSYPSTVPHPYCK
jgi:hypothetical protein